MKAALLPAQSQNVMQHAMSAVCFPSGNLKIRTHHDIKNREAKAQMLRRAGGVFPLYKAINHLPLLCPEAHGPTT